MTEWISWLSIVGMAPPGGEGGPSGLLGSPIFLVVMIIIMFYFILYKPEKTRRKERENLLKNLQRGDEVVTNGGIHGKITALTDNIVTLEIAPNVRIRVGRQFVSGVASKEGSDKESKGKDTDRAKDKGGKNKK